MVTTEINDHKSENEQRNQGSERRNNRPDQRRVHNPKWHQS